MDDNRFEITGVVTAIDDIEVKSPFFKLRNFKIRFSDVEFTGKAVERIIKFVAYNDETDMLDNVCLDDVVQIKFYIDGRDVSKDGKVYNFTNLIMKRVDVINSVSRTTQETREALVTKDGLMFDNSEDKTITIEDLMGVPKTLPYTAEANTIKSEFDDLPF